MNNDIRLDLNKTQQYKNIRLEYLTPSTEIYIYKSYRFRKSGAPLLSQFWLTPRLSAWPLRGHRALKSILEDILQPTKSKMSPTWNLGF